MSSAAVQPIVVLLSEAVGGDPTQYMIEKAIARHDLDWRYLAVEVSRENLGDAIRGIRAMGFRGGHCGSPHQQAVIPLLDRTSETAALVGAVNLIVREGDHLVGENTMGKGLIAALRQLANPAGKRAVLLGAGRIARAIAVALAQAKVSEITVVNRTEFRARELADLLAGRLHVPATPVAWTDDYQVPPDADLLLSATSIGAGGPDARVPVALQTLRSGMVVADVTTDPPHTWLLREAAQRGCVTLDGLSIYVEQVAIDFRVWTGIDPDREVLREAIEEYWEL